MISKFRKIYLKLESNLKILCRLQCMITISICLGEQERPLVHPKERAKAEARSQIKIEKQQSEKKESGPDQPQTDSQTNNSSQPAASKDKDENSSNTATKKHKQSTPGRTKQVKEKSEHYKNIFEVTCVEGKRQRKPKTVIDMEELSSKGEKTPGKNTGRIDQDVSQEAAEVEVNKPAAVMSPVVEKPLEWKMGDQLWAKVAGHPWWPCMIARDPYEDLFTKMKGEKIHRVWIPWHSIFSSYTLSPFLYSPFVDLTVVDLNILGSCILLHNS